MVGLVMIPSGSFLLGGPRGDEMATAIPYSRIKTAKILWDSAEPDPAAELLEQAPEDV